MTAERSLSPDPQDPAQSALCSIRYITGISIVVPIWREAENIPPLLDRLDALRRAHDLEVIFVDDDSRDGSVAAVAAAGHDWARLVVRTENRGLSPAVIDDFRMARHPVLVCMGCDLSHPTASIDDRCPVP